MKMSDIFIFCLLALFVPLFPGGSCSVPSRVAPTNRDYSPSRSALRRASKEAAEMIARREYEITNAVARMPLAAIFVLRERTSEAEFAFHRMDPHELKFFISAVELRFNENRDEISRLTADSIEKYRRSFLVGPARDRMLERRKARRALVMAQQASLGQLAAAAFPEEDLESPTTI